MSELQRDAGKMQVSNRAYVLLGEGTSRQGGEVLLHPICRAGIMSSK